MRFPLLRMALVSALALTMGGLHSLTGDDAKPSAKTDARPTTFDEIRPLLQAKCVRCHGDKIAKAELNLNTLAGALKGAEAGAVIVPGNPEKSHLFEQVHSGLMPPGKKDKLSEPEVELIRSWIAGGAKPGKSDVASAEPVSQHDVSPIVLRRCTACHGLHRKENGLDLRTKAAMLRGGKSGPAIVPSKPDRKSVV